MSLNPKMEDLIMRPSALVIAFIAFLSGAICLTVAVTDPSTVWIVIATAGAAFNLLLLFYCLAAIAEEDHHV